MTPSDVLEFDLSGLGVRLHGLPDSMGDRLDRHWARFRVARCDAVLLDVHVRVEGRAMPPGTTMSAGVAVVGADTGSIVELDEGAIELRSCDAQVRLAPGDPDRQYWGLINLLAIAVSWVIPERGGAVLHAAGVVLDGRAFVLVGPEGSGKTTFASLSEREGAQVLSDDIVVVDASGAMVHALSTPFRADQFPPVGPGRFPVAAVLLPERAAAGSRLDPVSSLTATARLTGSLFSLDPRSRSDPRSLHVIDRLASSVPCLRLAFDLESSFVDLLRTFRT